MANMGLSAKRGADFSNTIWSGLYKGEENQRQWEQEARAAEAAKRADEQFGWARDEQERAKQKRAGLQEATAVPEIRDYTTDYGYKTKGLFLGDKALGLGDQQTLEKALAEHKAGAGGRVRDVLTKFDPVEGMNFRASELKMAELEDANKYKQAGRAYMDKLNTALRAPGVSGMTDFLAGGFNSDEGDLGQGPYKGKQVQFVPAGAGKYKQVDVTPGEDGRPVMREVGEVTEDQIKDQFYFRAALGALTASGDSKGTMDFLRNHIKDKNDNRRLDLAEARAKQMHEKQMATLGAQQNALKNQQVFGRTDKGDVVLQTTDGFKVLDDDGKVIPFSSAKHGKFSQVKGLDSPAKNADIMKQYLDYAKDNPPKPGLEEAHRRAFLTTRAALLGDTAPTGGGGMAALQKIGEGTTGGVKGHEGGNKVPKGVDKEPVGGVAYIGRTPEGWYVRAPTPILQEELSPSFRSEGF